ncbi:MAG: hypothetical protein KAR20_09455, partial [Candidatus Heimdallarchaeota archaeon]|nr:hypothetical protein [Candidatus Heimdallarchaeota archaeon]
LILLYGLIKKRAINFVFSVLFFILAATLSVILFYDIAWFRGVRMLLFTSPFAIIVWGGVLAELSEDLPRKYKFLPWVVGIVIVALCLNQSFNLIQTMTSPKMIEFEQASIGFIESINHDDQYVLVAPLDVAIAYVDTHYPVKYAFLPASKPAFNLLTEKFTIGTVIYPVRKTRKKQRQQEDLLEFDMILEQQINFEGQEYLIFKPSN